MNTPDTAHELYEQLAAGYALSSLEPEDEQLFSAHLPGCAACERSVAEHKETLSHLAYAVVEGPPPPALLEGIRAGVAASGRAGSFPQPASLDAHRTRLRDRTVRWTTVAAGAAAAAALVIALVLVNHGMNANQQKKQDAAKLTSTISSLLVPGAQKVDLTGQHGGKGAVVVDGTNVSLVMAGVPVNDTSTSTYVLWEKGRSGTVRAVGTFDVGSERLAVIRDLHLADPTDPAAAFIVTREHGRTAPAVTTQPAVVAGQA